LFITCTDRQARTHARRCWVSGGSASGPLELGWQLHPPLGCPGSRHEGRKTPDRADRFSQAQDDRPRTGAVRPSAREVDDHHPNAAKQQRYPDKIPVSIQLLRSFLFFSFDWDSGRLFYKKILDANYCKFLDVIGIVPTPKNSWSSRNCSYSAPEILRARVVNKSMVFC
jgi:hypothetical protein